MADPDLPVLPPGYRLIARDEVGSTNDEARALIAAGAPAGCVVWATSQTAGRGRHGREWISPAGNLYCSIILKPSVDSRRLPELSFVAALATRDAVMAEIPAETAVTLKWPNDVLAGGRKIAGILVEAERLPDEARTALIVGIGINIASAPREVAYPATFIAAEARNPKPSRVLSTLVMALDRRVELWMRNGFGPIRQQWLDHAHGLGSRIAVEGGVSGIFAGLDESGAIVIATADGQRRRLVSGTVRYL
jgi:BirA family biotin operon repressor/biotin-[acetyl-CoA-carboxylase] ligase